MCNDAVVVFVYNCEAHNHCSYSLFSCAAFKLQERASAPCVECCGQVNFYAFSAFQLIEKKEFQRIVKESPWHSMKTVFGRTVS